MALTACSPNVGEDGPSSAEVASSNATTIDTDAGYTQPEQITEIGQVAEAMQNQLGDEFLLPNGDEWTLEHQDQNIRPVACSGDTYRYRIIFEYAEGLLREDVYAAGEAIAYELGLTPDENNHRGSAQMDHPAVFSSGNAEGRFLRVRGDESGIQVRYVTLCSDHHTMQETFERFAEEHRQERRERNPGPTERLKERQNNQQEDG